MKAETIMRYIVVDLEATCWEGASDRARMEIIEIGAVELESSSGPVAREFNSFVKPVATKTLSDFCRQLTTIRKEDVDGAEYFYQVFPRFLEWIGEAPFCLCSWGGYDLNQLQQDCARHKISFPIALENHINLKREFSRIERTRPLGMSAALRHLRLKAEGVHHRGIDDARNIARIAQRILPRVEAERDAETL